jgi:hypothetical protein
MPTERTALGRKSTEAITKIIKIKITGLLHSIIIVSFCNLSAIFCKPTTSFKIHVAGVIAKYTTG